MIGNLMRVLRLHLNAQYFRSTSRRSPRALIPQSPKLLLAAMAELLLGLSYLATPDTGTINAQDSPPAKPTGLTAAAGNAR